MNASIRFWTFAFLLSTLLAAGFLLAARHPAPVPLVPRDPAKLKPIDAELLLHRIREGDLVAMRGDLGTARIHWKAARAAGEGYWPVHEALGDSYARYRLESEAEREYAAADRIAQDQLGRAPVSVMAKRAALLHRMGRSEEALDLFIECGAPERFADPMMRILVSSPGLMGTVRRAAEVRDPRLWGLIVVASKDPAGRASALGRFARSVAPWDGQLARRAIDELRAIDRLEEAILVCRDWAKATPTELAAYELWGDLLAKSGRPDQALLALSTMVDVLPGDADAMRRLGAALRKHGRYADAIHQFEEASKLRPEEPFDLQGIILTHLEQGDLPAALREFAELTSRKWDKRFGHVPTMFRATVGPESARMLEAVRRRGGPEAAGRLRKFFADLGVIEAGLFDLKVVMTWDAMSDVDLDIMEPGGEVMNHGHQASKNGGVYHYDNTQGRGPEHYTLSRAPKGKYRVGVHLHGATRSAVDLEVILFEETSRERRLTAHVVVGQGTGQVWPLEFEIP